MYQAKYFDDSEFVCHCCGELPAGGMNEELVRRLDMLREQYGHPIYTSSAYRCPVHNRAVGGVSNSRHTFGDACDIYVDGDYNTFYRLVIATKLFDSVGYYPNREFVHVDLRNGGTTPNEYTWTEY